MEPMQAISHLNQGECMPCNGQHGRARSASLTAVASQAHQLFHATAPALHSANGQQDGAIHGEHLSFRVEICFDPEGAVVCWSAWKPGADGSWPAGGPLRVFGSVPVNRHGIVLCKLVRY